MQQHGVPIRDGRTFDVRLMQASPRLPSKFLILIFIFIVVLKSPTIPGFLGLFDFHVLYFVLSGQNK